MLLDASGNWTCPDDAEGRDVRTLDELNAMHARSRRGPRGHGDGVSLEHSVSGAGSPETIMAGNVVAVWDAGSGIITSGGLVSSWIDKFAGLEFVQATASAQPTYDATGAPNYLPCVRFNGTTTKLVCSTIALPAPATTRTFYWAILRALSWKADAAFWGAGTNVLNLSVLQHFASPSIRMANQTRSNTHAGLAVGAWKYLEAYFSASTSDYLRAGETKASTGTSAGNFAPNPGLTLGCDPASGGIFFSRYELAELCIFNVLPSAAQLAALRRSASAKFRGGLG